MTTSARESPNPRPSAPAWAWAALLVLALVLAYARVWRFDFNWDDDMHITANPTIVGPLGFADIWTSAKANYFPLTMTCFWLQHALWGLAPGPYHGVTLLFHIGAAVLLWQVLRQLRVPAAWFCAMVWALHPVQVESVAWICELKNTLSGVFYLLAIGFFVRWLQRAEPPQISREYVAAVAAAALAILGKSSTVMLPVVLGLIGWWLGRRSWREARWLAPFFAISLLASAWTIWEQKVNSGAAGAEWDYGLAARLTIAGKVPWFYLGKLLWPHPLVFIYPRWPTDSLGLNDWLPLCGWVAVGVWLWRWRDSRLRPVFIALTYFFVSLFPVLGLFDAYFFRYSFVGDHFQYLASMGPLALIAAGLANLGLHTQRVPARACSVVAAVVLVGLGCLTFRQTAIYRDRETLWRDTAERNPRAQIAHMNLGAEYGRMGRHDLAVAHYEQAVRLKPDDPLAEVNLGAALHQLGRSADALPHLERAVWRSPDMFEVQHSLGAALAALGRMPEAIEHLEAALRLRPQNEETLLGLATCLQRVGRPAEALDRLAEAVRSHPQSGRAHRMLATALAGAGKNEEAFEHYRAAVGLDADDYEAWSALAQPLLRRQMNAEAIAAGQAMVRLRPDDAKSWFWLGNVLLFSGRAGEAVPQFARALQLQPDLVDARENLGYALIQSQRPAEAVSAFEAVVRARPQSARAHNNLGTALLQTNQVAPALEQFREALRLEPESIETRMNLAVALTGAGRPAEAAAEYEEVLRRDPQHAGAKDQLARLRAR